MALRAEEVLAIANQYTDDTVIGGGAIKGKNCTIESIEPISGGQRVTFKWTLDDGTEQTTTMDVMNGVDGQDGKGIKSVAVNEESHLIITYTDDTTYDAGAIEVHSAVDSVNGKTGEVTLDASDVGALPDNTSIPSKTSDLANDSNFVADANYVHTDNNYDATAKDIVDGVTTALAGKVDKETGKSLIDLTTVVDGASYDSTNHLILFKNGTTTLFSLDAAAFVKDGMVDTVTITGGNLVITFNTDAGKQAISIPITDIFDPANYYDKTATDGLLADKVSKSNTAGLLKNDGTVDTDTFVKTSSTAGLLKNDGTVDTTTYATKASVDAIKDGQNIDSFADVETALDGKADKVTSAVSGNFAGLDASGNLVDSGKKASDFVSAANLDALNQIAAGIYEGTDLTVKFADEIANYTDEWAWVQARLDAHDVSGMLPGDYIPIVVGTETHQAQIAGINPYFDTCDSGYEVKYHIDWITRDCYGGATVKWNNSDNNNGSSAEASPFLASNLNSWLNTTLYGLLEAKLKAVIKEKRILAPTRYQSGQSLTDDNSWAWKTTGKLWVPYETEIFDNVQWSTKGFGESQNVQYEIFRNSYRARRKKQGPTGARASWWTASAISGNATNAVLVTTNGNSTGYSASTSRYAPVCFRTMATT